MSAPCEPREPSHQDCPQFRKIRVHSRLKQSLADLVSPVSMFLRLRARFPGSLLLEGADYHASENSFSYLCICPQASFIAHKQQLNTQYPDGQREHFELAKPAQMLESLSAFINAFESVKTEALPAAVINGVFGYVTHEAVQYFEDISLSQARAPSEDVPDICYQAFRFILAIDHFRNRLYALENSFEIEGVPLTAKATGPTLEELLRIAMDGTPCVQAFESQGQESSNFSDQEHLELISQCKKHISRGDVFQIVPSRKFSQRFTGDDFQVYRCLRSINPSPYLFYYDYPDFHIFGSSPEAQILVQHRAGGEREAGIYPIAGTCKRSADEVQDQMLMQQLREDPKENAEHVMLVDLARNDLSKHCSAVRVKTLREVQVYSHVMHLVSAVVGTLKPGVTSQSIFADTFPAGTLSGAPKYKALQLIDRYERGARRVYGGALGFFGFNGDCVHAITIRTFLSKDQILHYQAGGGVVADSVPENEVLEIKNKLAALGAAIRMATDMVP
jgi:anthranilate synthase component 1